MIKIKDLNKNEILFIMDIVNNIQLLGAFFILGAGHLLASIIIAKYIYLPWVKKNELENIEPIIKYEDKFSLEDIKDTIVKPEDVSCNVYVSEHTPDGYVIMRYNNKEEGFEYWCDNSSIKYSYLEVVSRKYVDKLLCKNLYKDRLKEEEKEEELKEEELKENEKEEDELKEEDDVFVKPKISKENNKKKELRKVSNVEGNKYIKKGKINELKVFKYEQKKKEPKKKMSFYDYKLLMKKAE